MEFSAYHGIFIFIVLFGQVHTDGHYRCTWHNTDHPHDHPVHFTNGREPDQQMRDTSSQSTSQCTDDDSIQMTSYINHCTHQSYVPLITCNSDGHWNCESLQAMCQTLVGSKKSPKLARHSLLPPQAVRTGGIPTDPPSHAGMSKFNPNENYFTMKEMGVAVLVSFIAGAIMLAIVILIVWRCRNVHLNSEQRMEAAQKEANHMAALHMLTQLTAAVKGGRESQTSTVSNPNYGQIISSKDIMEEVLSEQERIYEEILTRRRSSCIHPECIYANIEKLQMTNGKRQRLSQSSLHVIDEATEHDTPSDDISSSGDLKSIRNNTSLDDVNSLYAVVNKKMNNASQNVAYSPRLGVKSASKTVSNDIMPSKGPDDLSDSLNGKKQTDSGYLDETNGCGQEVNDGIVDNGELRVLGDRKPSLKM